MNDPTQRQQWEDHLKDEADELGRQQERAGAGHSPLAGPLPHSRADLSDAAAAAGGSVRQRCADIAREWARPEALRRAFPQWNDSELQAATAALGAVAQAIESDARSGQG